MVKTLYKDSLWKEWMKVMLVMFIDASKSTALMYKQKTVETDAGDNNAF